LVAVTSVTVHAANWTGDGAARKRQYRDKHAFEDIVIFSSQPGTLKDAAT
jgi:hypothetical protein